MTWQEKLMIELHPGCQKAWDRGLTNYPKEEHARDCERCQKWMADKGQPTGTDTGTDSTGQKQ